MRWAKPREEANIKALESIKGRGLGPQEEMGGVFPNTLFFRLFL